MWVHIHTYILYNENNMSCNDKSGKPANRQTLLFLNILNRATFIDNVERTMKIQDSHPIYYLRL